MEAMAQDEEYRLIKLAQAGDREAAGILLRQHHWKLTSIAATTKARAMDFEDKYQSACKYFLESIHKFDCSRGVRLSTFTYLFVAMRVRNEALFTGLIRINWNARFKYRKEMLQAMSPAHELNPKGPVHADAVRVEDTVLSGVESREEWDMVSAMIRRLPPREQQALRLRLQGLTLTECGVQMGCTKERVRQIESSAIARLQRQMQNKLTPKLDVV
jgi:RNA polymerase sigma factor (sigma-70 family)